MSYLGKKVGYCNGDLQSLGFYVKFVLHFYFSLTYYFDRKTTGLLTTGLLTTGHVTIGLLDNWSFGQLVL